MSDRVQMIMAVPVDHSLPVDVQGVQWRRKAIDLMEEVAEIDESSVRYQGSTDNAVISLGGDLLPLWQLDLIAVQWTADGKAKKDITGAVIHRDNTQRFFSSTEVVRDPFA